jgi:hypothetical protein
LMAPVRVANPDISAKIVCFKSPSLPSSIAPRAARSQDPLTVMLTTYPVRVPYPEAGLWKIRDVRPPMGLPCRFMRVVRRVGAAAVAVAFAALLGGCSPQVQPPPPKPSPSSSPVFASDEEALAAATKAYAAYLNMAGTILSEGGESPNRIEKYASGDALRTSLDGYQEFSTKNYKAIGTSTFDHVSLQHFSSNARGVDVVALYVCLDVAEVDVVDAKGASVVSPSRPARQPLELSFDLDVGKRLLLASIEPWKGGNFCDS